MTSRDPDPSEPPVATPPEPSNSEAIQAGIEQTRDDLGESIGALSEKADVKAQASAKAGELKQRAQDVSGEVTQRAGAVAENVKRRPAPVIVGGIALLTILRLLLRRRRRRDEWTSEGRSSAS
jgi:hypothetical protein